MTPLMPLGGLPVERKCNKDLADLRIIGIMKSRVTLYHSFPGGITKTTSIS